MVDRTIIATLEQMRSFDYVQGNHDMLLGVGNLAQDVLSSLSLTATSQVVVAGLAATQTSTPSLTVNIGAGRIYSLAAADATAVSAITADSTIVCQQGAALPQTVTLVAPTTGQSQWNLIQCQFQQGDAVRANDPTNGVVPFYNVTNPAVPNPATINTVRQARCIVQVLSGAAATTGSEVPPTPSNGWSPLYLIDLVGGQTQITTGQILKAGPSVGTGVPSNYPVAPFLAGFLASHHSGAAGQAPKVNLASEVQGVLPYANMSPVRTLLTASLSLFVNGSTGNDSNSGTSPSLAFRTIQAAVNSAYHNYDFNGNSCTISVANGNYPVTPAGGGGAVVFSGLPVGMPAGGLFLTGNAGSPGSVTLTVTNGHGVVGQSGAYVTVSGMTVTCTGGVGGIVTTAGYGCLAATGATVSVQNMTIGSCPGAQLRAQVGGLLLVSGPITFTGTTPASLSSDSVALLWTVGQTLTFSALTLTLAFANALNASVITLAGPGGTTTFVGTPTGPRFNVQTNAVLNVNGGGLNFIPGTAAGGTATGGQYN